uniref:ribosomal protein L12 n=1 Tax=Lietzensia polymorpha TaxID=2962110 RepID=UPI0021822840|nr:ribosomal protein L12 [Lietzensia polymorpha]UVI61195.1 ribosomal protein L12 [Lietzensia polymorpha]
MSGKTDQILEDLKSLTLIEVSDLVEKLEKTFNIDASQAAGFVVGAPAAAAGPAQPAEEAKTEFDVILAEAPPADKKLGVLKVVRTLTGLGLKEAKDLVESAPKPIKEKASKTEADDIKKQIEEAGGKITLK